MRNSIIILVFIFSASIFNVHKSCAQNSTEIQDTILKYKLIHDSLLTHYSALIDTFNALIYKVDKDFSVDTDLIENNIDSVQIDSLNNLYFVRGTYIDTTDEDNSKYGKFYVLKYGNHQFSIIDSTSRFIYDDYTIVFEVYKDTLSINFSIRWQSNNYTYLFNKYLQKYQLLYLGGVYGYHSSNDSNWILSSNYDIKKQLLSWEITNDEDENYKKVGKKKIILPKDFSIQLQELNIGDCDSILTPPEWNK